MVVVAEHFHRSPVLLQHVRLAVEEPSRRLSQHRVGHEETDIAVEVHVLLPVVDVPHQEPRPLGAVEEVALNCSAPLEKRCGERAPSRSAAAPRRTRKPLPALAPSRPHPAPPTAAVPLASRSPGAPSAARGAGMGAGRARQGPACTIRTPALRAHPRAACQRPAVLPAPPVPPARPRPPPHGRSPWLLSEEDEGCRQPAPLLRSRECLGWAASPVSRQISVAGTSISPGVTALSRVPSVCLSVCLSAPRNARCRCSAWEQPYRSQCSTTA